MSSEHVASALDAEGAMAQRSGSAIHSITKPKRSSSATILPEDNDDITRKTKESEYQPEGTVFITIVNLSKNMIGSGLLSLPLTIFDGSLFVAVSWIVIMGCLSGACFWATAVISQGKCETYGDVWGLVVGQKTKFIPSVLLTLNGLITAAQ